MVQGGLVILLQVVQCGLDGDYVYQLQFDNMVKMQLVIIGQEVGDSYVMVMQGLKVGDKVVIEGQFCFKLGSKVKVFKLGEVLVVLIEEEFKKVVQDNKGGCCGYCG